jgi:amino acid transporter/mannitol/fructose-specific phosphotransferase system IIA component (Ntr-type)
MKKLDRELGLVSVISIACGAMVSGLLVLPGYAAKMTGASAYLAFMLAGILFIPATLSKSEMTTALPESGGDYLFIDRALGPFFSTVSGIGMFLTFILKAAFALAGMAAYLFLLIPVPTQYDYVFAALVAFGLVVLNYRGAKKSGQMQSVLISLTAIVLVLFLMRGSIEVDSHLFRPFFKGGWEGFLAATAFVFVSYAGVTKVASVAEEVKNPGRNVPVGMIVSLLLMILFYTGVVYITMGTVPIKELISSPYADAPLARAGLEISGSVGMWIMAGISALALAAMANAGVLASSRYPLALARQEQFPKMFEKIHPKFSTPSVAVVATGVLLISLILFLPVVQLAKLASTFKLIVLALFNASLIILRESDIEWYQPEFRSPMYPYIQLFGIVSCLGLIVFLGWLPLLASAGLIAASSLWYFFYVRDRVTREGALFRSEVAEEEFELFERVRSRSYTDKQSVIVPFFELEETDMLHAERRIRLAAALCDYDERLDIVYFGEVAEQSFLNDYEMNKAVVDNLRERIDMLRPKVESEIHFDQVVTHNSRKALENYAEQERPHWVVLDWMEPSPWKNLLGKDKWWLDDFPCDQLLFDDREKLQMENVLVLTEPGPYDGEVVYAADHIADFNDGSITFINPVDADNERAEEFVSGYQEEIMGMCRVSTTARRIPEDEWEEQVLEAASEHDLLVVGGLSHQTFPGFDAIEHARSIVEESPCSVARVRSNLRSPRTVLGKRKGQINDLSTWLYQDNLVTKLEVDSKEQLFKRIGEEVSRDYEGLSPATITDALWDRERQQNTYIENKIAFPHAIVDDVQRTELRFFVLDEPIPYTEDEKKASVCVVTIGPPDDRRVHLEIIGQTTELLSDRELRQTLADPDMSERSIEALIRERFSTIDSSEGVLSDGD